MLYNNTTLFKTIVKKVYNIHNRRLIHRTYLSVQDSEGKLRYVDIFGFKIHK